MRLLACIIILILSPCGAEAYEGWGAGTVPGVNVYNVTSLADSGPGTLRDAVSVGNRNVRFLVAGNIVLASEIRVRGSKVLIDGLSSPAPGITLYNKGIRVLGSDGANNVIIRGLRIYNATTDGLQFASGTYNFVVDRVTIGGSVDGAIDITEYAQYGTVSNSFLVGDQANGKVSLLKFGALRVAYHHNTMIGNQRVPQVDSEGIPITDIHADIVNNLIVEVSPPTRHGVLVQNGAAANVRLNLFIGPRGRDVMQAPLPSYAYVAGNVMYAGSGDPNQFGTWATPFATAFVTTQSACIAGGIAANAGAPYADDAFEASVWAWLGTYIASLPAGQGC